MQGKRTFYVQTMNNTFPISQITGIEVRHRGDGWVLVFERGGGGMPSVRETFASRDKLMAAKHLIDHVLMDGEIYDHVQLEDVIEV